MKNSSWEFKFCELTSSSGYVHKLLLIDGVKEQKQANDTELYREIVSEILKDISLERNHKIFLNNPSCTMNEFTDLQQKGYHFVGVLRKKDLKHIPLMPDKLLSRRKRGSFDWVINKENNIAVVKWFNIKILTYISSYVAFDKPDQLTITPKDVTKPVSFVCRPAIVRERKKFKINLDVKNCINEMYNYSLRCRHWYLYPFMYSLNVIVRNAYILHERDSFYSKQKKLSFKLFTAMLAKELSSKIKPLRNDKPSPSVALGKSGGKG